MESGTFCSFSFQNRSLMRAIAGSNNLTCMYVSLASMVVLSGEEEYVSVGKAKLSIIVARICP